MKKRKKKKKNSKQFNRQFKKTFFTKKSAIIIVCTVIILSAFWGAYQKVERKAAKYQKTIDELKTEVKNLNQTNKTLEKEKNNIDTDESKERIARERLGMIKEGEIVLMIIGRDCFPVCKITPRFMPNPSRTTAVCKIILDVHLIPDSAVPFSVQKQVITIPARIAMTGPPITGNAFPISQDGIAIRKQTRIPLKFF